jgi:4-amino-4-deoxy-L-arabinose transferase-like glycosyltransferase
MATFTDQFWKTHKAIVERPFVVLISAFLLVQVVLFIQYGVFTGLEAEKYVTQGNLLYETGRLSDTKYIFYLPVILLVYGCKFLGASYFPVVIVQVMLAMLAMLFFYKLASKLENPSIAFYSALLLSLFIPLQTWNFFLYSDSIFISLTIIYAYLIIKYGEGRAIASGILLLFLILLIFSRPHGLLFIPPTIVYLVFKKQPKSWRTFNIILCLLLVVLMYLLLNVAFTGGEDMDAMKPFIEEHIICFVPENPQGAALNVIHSGNPVNDIFYYLFHNPLHFLKLTALKLFSFFNLTRPYYSTAHNVALAVVFIPLYFFAVVGILKTWRTFSNFRLYLFSLLVLYPLGATFQCDDWHSRFTMVIFPYLILLACNGAYYLFKKHVPRS